MEDLSDSETSVDNGWDHLNDFFFNRKRNTNIFESSVLKIATPCAKGSLDFSSVAGAFKSC